MYEPQRNTFRIRLSARPGLGPPPGADDLILGWHWKHWGHSSLTCSCSQPCCVYSPVTQRRSSCPFSADLNRPAVGSPPLLPSVLVSCGCSPQSPPTQQLKTKQMSGDQKSEVRVSGQIEVLATLPPETLRETGPRLFRRQAAAGIPWLLAASLTPTSASHLRGALPPRLLSVSDLPRPLSDKDAGVSFRANWITEDVVLISRSSRIRGACCHVRWHSQVPGFRPWELPWPLFGPAPWLTVVLLSLSPPLLRRVSPAQLLAFSSLCGEAFTDH